MIFILFLSSGLFLGWSLGANDGANVFGTAVGSKMVRFRTAAIIASACVILGAWLSGRGASRTLEQLGEINEIAGAFVVAFAAAITLYWMTRLKLPVSASQAIVGAIIGWNLFSSSLTDIDTLQKIVLTWIICPILAALFSLVFYYLSKLFLLKTKIHLIKLDSYNRIGLILVGAFGAYSLGANNIANVMGVFVPVSPFGPLSIGTFGLSSVEQLFILGGIAIAVGIFTYSHRVMTTVGENIVKLTPVSALTVVLSASLVLFVFASQGLKSFLTSHGLPSFPLVPVSSSQAIVGAVLGIGLAHGGRGINFKLLGKVASGWVVTPLIASILSFIALFIMQNVFSQNVFQPVNYTITNEVIDELRLPSIQRKKIEIFSGVVHNDAVTFKRNIDKKLVDLDETTKNKILRYSRIHYMKVNINDLSKELKSGWLSQKQISALKLLQGKEFRYKWQLHNSLMEQSKCWTLLPEKDRNKRYNNRIIERLHYIYRIFHIKEYNVME